jgi:hypothetical protein
MDTFYPTPTFQWYTVPACAPPSYVWFVWPATPPARSKVRVRYMDGLTRIYTADQWKRSRDGDTSLIFDGTTLVAEVAVAAVLVIERV